MGTRLGDLVERFGGQLVGDPNLEVSGIAPLDSADASHISFLSNSKLRALAAQSSAAALILSPLDDTTVATTFDGARIVTTNPYAYFARTAQYFAALEETPPAPGVHPSAVVHDTAEIDPTAQIGHNCHIGAHTAMAGCVGVAGSAKIGKNCTFGGAAMVLGHLEIADNVHISSGSMVSRSVLEPGQYTGFYPLAKNTEWEKSAAIVRNLTSMREKIRTLEKQIKQLTELAEQK